MFKRIAAFIIFILCSSFSLFAQKNKNVSLFSDADRKSARDSSAGLYTNKLPPITKYSRDFWMLQLGYYNFASKPDSVKVKGLGYTTRVYLAYDFPIKKSKMSFATGVGINASVVFLDNQILANNDTGAYGSAAHIINNSTYKRYKFTTAYLQAPFELRYYSNIQNRNIGFKAAIGLEVGTLLGAHTKGLRSVGGTTIKDKENTKRYLSPWNFDAIARIGWGNFTIFGTYNVTGVFKDLSGPALTPMSIGLCVSGL